MGRKTIFAPETLAVGEKMEAKGKVRKYIYQYINNFNRRLERTNTPMKFKRAVENDKIFIIREL